MRRALPALLLVAVAALAACAAPPAPADRARVNAEKQEALKEMLEKGQRN